MALRKGTLSLVLLASFLVPFLACGGLSVAPPRATRASTHPPRPPAPPMPAQCSESFRSSREPSVDFPSPYNSDRSAKRLPPSPPNEPGRAIVFDYFDFGPQSMSARLIGTEWYSWGPCGCFEPGDAFDVRVVVYQGSEEDTKTRYPSVPGASDYRVVPRAEALRYLDEALGEVASLAADPDEEYDWGPLRRDLERTRRAILDCLPYTTGRN